MTDTKTCTKCGRELPLSRFRVHKRDGIVARCKDCERETFKKWLKTAPKGQLARKKNKARWRQTENGKASLKKAKLKWLEGHGSETAAYNKNYRESERGREVNREAYSRYYQKTGREKKAAYKKEHPEKFKKYANKYNNSEKGKAARKRHEYKRRLVRALTLITLEALENGTDEQAN